ncbi:MAG: hypothetical protein ABTQ32_24890 [Myxococcaceae bacterium]
MRPTLKRRVNSRTEANALPPIARVQLQAAGRTLLGARDFTSLMAWSEREGIGWYQLVIEDARGAPTWEVWLLTSGDDGVIFTHGASDHLGLILSQSYVVDVQAARNDLVEGLQQAIDRFVPPVFRGWVNEESHATVKLKAISLPWSSEES